MRTYQLLTLSLLLSTTAFGCTKDEDEPTATATATVAMTTGDAPTTGGTTTDGTTGAPTTTDPTTGGVELTCESYCEIYATACKDFSEYDNTDACLAQCGQWPLGEVNATAGDSLGCRLYHVTVASTTDPNVHCPHAGPNGAATCVEAGAPTCEAYCSKYFANCKDDLNLYIDEADCAAKCAEWYPGKENDAAGDSVGCRLYHAGAALYADIIARTDNPEFMDAVAGIHRAAGRTEAAAPLIARADAIYEAQLLRFPEAAYGHALEHFLEFGADPKRTVTLAEANHRTRPNAEAKISLARAYLQAGRKDDARKAIDEALATPWNTADLHAVAAEVLTATGDAAAASEQRRLALAINPAVLD